MKLKIGLIVNPIAGIGGSVALKGSDEREIVEEAFRRRGKPLAPDKAISFLKTLKPHLEDSMTLITCKGDMGEKEASNAGISKDKVALTIGRDVEVTTVEDTKTAAAEMMRLKTNIIVFCGGDGTARDVMDVVDLKTPVLGIPGGVKMESAVFAVNPEAAAALTVRFLRDSLPLAKREVVDVDEKAYRRGILSTRLYGYLKVPDGDGLLQGIKTPSSSVEDERYSQKAIAKYVVEGMDGESVYIIGPGSTTKAVLEEMGLEGTLLGVDMIRDGNLIASDVSEFDLLRYMKNSEYSRFIILVTPIGGQGYIFGRGNQQLSPKVLRKVGRDNIVVLATMSKILSLPKLRLLVDTGDNEVDSTLTGYMRVVVDYGRELVVKVETGFG